MGSIVAVAIGVALVAFVMKLFRQTAAIDRPARTVPTRPFPTTVPTVRREPAGRSPTGPTRAATDIPAPEPEPGRAAPMDDATTAMMAALTGPGICTPVRTKR